MPSPSNLDQAITDVIAQFPGWMQSAIDIYRPALRDAAEKNLAALSDRLVHGDQHELVDLVRQHMSIDQLNAEKDALLTATRHMADQREAYRRIKSGVYRAAIGAALNAAMAA